MRSIKNLEVTMNSSNRYLSTPIFEVKQEDDVTLELAVVDENGPVDLTDQVAIAYFKLPNGVSYDCRDIVIEDSIVKMDLSSAYTSASGKVTFELELTDSNGVSTTQTYFYLVKGRVKSEASADPSVYDKMLTLSDKIYEYLVKLDSKVLEVDEVMKELNTTIESSEDTKKELQNSLESCKVDLDKTVGNYKDEVNEVVQEGTSYLTSTTKNCKVDLESIIAQSLSSKDTLNSTIESSHSERLRLLSVIETSQESKSELETTILESTESRSSLLNLLETAEVSSNLLKDTIRLSVESDNKLTNTTSKSEELYRILDKLNNDITEWINNFEPENKIPQMQEDIEELKLSRNKVTSNSGNVYSIGVTDRGSLVTKLEGGR